MHLHNTALALHGISAPHAGFLHKQVAKPAAGSWLFVEFRLPAI
jgi:hypothetical protein